MLSLGKGKSMPNVLGITIISFGKALIYCKRDVIVFKGNDGRSYCHRITSIDYLDTESFTTKGDNHSESKPYEINVPIKNIEGLVTWSYPDFYKNNK